MQITYAVAWQEPDGRRHSGRLDLGLDEFRLEGRDGDGPAEKVVQYTSVRAFQMASSADRLQGRPTLLLDLSDGSQLKITSVAQPGIVAEIAHRLGELTGRQDTCEREALVVPLRPGSQAKAEALLADGPPFDPADFGLESHEVFVTDSEVVFVFEGAPGRFSERLAAEQTVWKAAEAWRPLIAGPVRLGLQAYAWPS